MAAMVRASAPGKLVLVGEYAVLTGSRALVMAIKRRARVAIREGKPGLLRIRSNLFSSTAELAVDQVRAATVETAKGACKDWQWLLRVLGFALDRVGMRTMPAANIELDTSDFFHTARGKTDKLGIGSSAALSVALCTAVSAFLNDTPEAKPWAPDAADMISAHREFQQASGSGIDVAAACYGGLLQFQMDAPPRPVPWPDELRFRFIWSGASASTKALVQGVMAWRLAQPDGARTLFRRMADVASKGIASVSSGNMPEVLRSFAEYGELMGELGEAAEVDILSPVHRRIQTLAEKYEVAYKPSGAGGGDVGLLFHCEDEVLDRVLAELAQDGIAGVGAVLEPQGVALC